MHLLPCIRPHGTLESAPRTSLRVDSDGERWEGFWCVEDERYYARCLTGDGSEQWYRFADEVAPSRRKLETRVLPLRPKHMVTPPTPRMLTYGGQRMLLCSSRVSGRSILIGASHRRPPRRPAGGAR